MLYIIKYNREREMRAHDLQQSKNSFAIYQQFCTQTYVVVNSPKSKVCLNCLVKEQRSVYVLEGLECCWNCICGLHTLTQSKLGLGVVLIFFPTTVEKFVSLKTAIYITTLSNSQPMLNFPCPSKLIFHHIRWRIRLK